MENKTEIFEVICKKIMNLDPAIRISEIINDKGKLIAGGTREGVKLLVDEKESEMILMEIALMVRMRREHDNKLGPVNFTLSHREKVVLISFPIGDDILYVSAAKEIDLGKIPSKVLQILKSDLR